MPTRKLKLNSKPILVHKATIEPTFNKKSILVDNPWEYIELWIKRKGNNRALFYWQQSQGFYKATKSLPKTSSPLTAYYCFLNATKALLELKQVAYADRHGVTGGLSGNVASLANENIKFQSNGVLSEFSRLLGEQVNGETYTFKELIYNLCYIHRAYTLTYSTDPELFFPIHYPHFVKIDRQNEAFLTAEIKSDYYKNQNTINKLPSTLERDLGFPEKHIIRKVLPESKSAEELVICSTQELAIRNTQPCFKSTDFFSSLKYGFSVLHSITFSRELYDFAPVEDPVQDRCCQYGIVKDLCPLFW